MALAAPAPPTAAQSDQTQINLIPRPASIKRLSGQFKFGRQTKIVVRDQESRQAADLLNDYLKKSFALTLEIVTVAPVNNAIYFDSLNESDSRTEDSYRVLISPNAVRLSGRGAGTFYAIQSFLQFLPAKLKGTAGIPAVEINDTPRFPYRRMHLDVGRHFFSVEFIKKYLDLMAQYKFNRFHWHLTDDQGWRIEIKKYPRLTEIGGYREETEKGKNFMPFVGDGIPHGGFYTQEQIREIVAYAKARYITIIPEIEMPGHSSAALAAYPEFGCKENYPYKVPTTWNIFKEIYCPTEQTFKFLEDVLAEVIDLFPDSPYIHIGGDEVPQDHWKESAFVQELKRREGLKDEHEVQSYFIRRIEKFVNSKGKKIIGWDEILEGGLAPNAVVMSWHGEKGGIEAAKAKHEVVMAAQEFLYFNFGQGDPKYEPINHANHLPLEKVYSYDPLPKELSQEEAKYILGAQGNVWTEYFKTPEQIEYQILPRMLALAEVIWSQPENKNYQDFHKRLQSHFAHFDQQKINYRIPEPAGLRNIILQNRETARFELRSQIDGGRIFYTTDGSEPDQRAKLYTKPFDITLKPQETRQVKTIVVNAAGRKSVTYAATVRRTTPSSAVELNTETKPGVNLSFFKGDFQNINELDRKTPAETGESNSIRIGQFSPKTNGLKEPFGVIFEGFIYIPEEEIYEFQLETDDSAVLAIGRWNLVEIDGVQTKQSREEKLISSSIIPLARGLHKFRLKYIQKGGEAALDVFWGVKGQGLKRLRGPELVH